MKSFFKSRRIRLLVLLFAVAGGLLWFWNSRNPPGGAEWLSGPLSARPARLAFLGKWMWPVKRQLSRLKQIILGTPKIVDIKATIIEFTPSALESDLPALITALTNRSGAKVFIVASDAKGFEERVRKTTGVEVLSGPRMTVADGMQSQMAGYQTMPLGRGTNVKMQHIGWWLDALPAVRARAVELTCFLTGTEQASRDVNEGDDGVTNESFLRTNVAFGARVSIPTNGSLFLIAGSTNQKGKVIGAILSPTVHAK